MLRRLKWFVLSILILAVASGAAYGAWWFAGYSEGREEELHFYAGIVYGVIVALFVGANLAVLQFLALNFVFPLYPEIDFEEMKFPILVVQGVVALLLVLILALLLPMPLSEW